MIRPKLFFLIVFFIPLLFTLQGCATRGAVTGFEDAQFEISGKLGIRWDAERFSARFRWAQQQDRYAIELWGPLGQGRTFLQGDVAGMEIRDGGGNLIDRGPVHSVMTRQLGWYLPLEALPRWVSGRPLAGPPSTNVEMDGAGQMLAFNQLGWRLSFDRYVEDQPRRITAEKEGYRVRIVL